MYNEKVIEDKIEEKINLTLNQLADPIIGNDMRQYLRGICDGLENAYHFIEEQMQEQSWSKPHEKEPKQRSVLTDLLEHYAIAYHMNDTTVMSKCEAAISAYKGIDD